MKDYTNYASAQSTTIDAGLRSHMIKVYNYMAAGLGVSGLVAYFAYTSPEFAALAFQLRWVCFFAILGMAFLVMPRMYSMSENGAKLTFFAYSAILSISIAPMFAIYTGESIARTFFITASVFGGLSLLGYTTKKDLTSWGTFGAIGVIGVFFAGLLNYFFFKSTGMQLVTNIVAIIAVIALTAYDTQKVKQAYYVSGGNPAIANKSAIIGALQLYFDFVYLFIHLMQILGNRR
ncbi:MAG: Bax inhibitor-1/YccA family protein [Rickettsiales bacterium]|nr:Bax inhibitor-1/YccA family protein [Rickettsiales bacterium]